MSKIWKVLSAAALTASIANADIWNKNAEQVLKIQDEYKAQIAKFISKWETNTITGSNLAKLWLSIDYDGLNLDEGTLVAWPAMLEEQHCDDCEVPYSKIGLDYLDITKWDKQLAEMLAEGEEEFFGNIDAVVEYKWGKKRYKRKSRQENIWKEIVKFLWQWRIFKDQLRMLDVWTPNMLKQFADLDENKYDILESIWEFKKSEERFKKSEERFKKSEERFKKADEWFKKADERFKKADERFKKSEERLKKIKAMFWK